MTIDEILLDPTFNKSEISLQVFGHKRAISDKSKGHRNNKWRNGDKEAIAKYFSNKYQLNLQVT